MNNFKVLVILRKAISQANDGRHHILTKMLECIDKPNEQLSKFAPEIITFNINPEKIREVIGTGGKVINKIIEETGVKIDITDDGVVAIAAVANHEMLMRAKAIILSIAKEPEVGDMFLTEVVRILSDKGAFCEIAPGKDGMIPIAEMRMGKGRIDKVEDVLNLGDMVMVEIIDIREDKRHPGKMLINLKLLEKVEK